MQEINTFEYAMEFCNHVEKIMKQYECIGNYKWGNPAGQSEGIPTYQIVTP